MSPTSIFFKRTPLNHEYSIALYNKIRVIIFYIYSKNIHLRQSIAVVLAIKYGNAHSLFIILNKNNAFIIAWN